MGKFLDAILLGSDNEDFKTGFKKILKKIISLCQNNIDMLNGLGGILINLFYQEKVDNELGEAIVENLWTLKHLCPKDVIVYAINHTKKVFYSILKNYQFSTKRYIEEALKLCPQSIEIWKTGLKCYKDLKLFTELPKLLNKYFFGCKN